MAHEGYYFQVDKSAPAVVHKHFFQWVDYIEFLHSVLSPACVRANISQCVRLSTFMGLPIESYEDGDRVIYFTPELFMTQEETEKFITNYTMDNFDGIRPQLDRRERINLKDYVLGRISLSLQTDICINGCMEVRFSDEGCVVLPFLYFAAMFYKTPSAGNFQRIEVDTDVPSIKFYGGVAL
jgi:hypothetical protein